MIRSLRARLILSHILPVLVIIPLAAFALFYVLETQFLLPTMADNLSQDARYLAEISRPEFQLFGNPVFVSNMLNRVGLDPAIQVMFMDADGRLLFTSDDQGRNQLGTLVVSEGINQAQAGEEVILTNYSIFRLNDVLVDVFSPVKSSQEQVIGVVRVSYRSESIFLLLSRLRNLITVVLILGLVVGMTLGSILGFNIANPIRKVTAAVYGLVQGERKDTLPEEGPQEIRDLSRAVNQLVERLGNLETARRHLLANLVHELGRPLGAIRSGIQSILRGADQDPQLMGELTRGIDEEAARMQHVLDELAHLHDEVIGTLELHKEPILFSEWLPKVLVPWQQAASEKDIRWHEDIADHLPSIHGDPIRLAQVFGNLASNAIKYTPQGGSVWISTGANKQQIWVRFKDNGSGIPVQEHELIFEPFYRGQQGRKIKQGMGLGLSITRDILHAHGGEIELVSAQAGGSQFTVWLPRS
jgi:two-component system sensor histidine kinase BaeS